MQDQGMKLALRAEYWAMCTTCKQNRTGSSKSERKKSATPRKNLVCCLQRAPRSTSSPAILQMVDGAPGEILTEFSLEIVDC